FPSHPPSPATQTPPSHVPASPAPATLPAHHRTRTQSPSFPAPGKRAWAPQPVSGTPSHQTVARHPPPDRAHPPVALDSIAADERSSAHHDPRRRAGASPSLPYSSGHPPAASAGATTMTARSSPATVRTGFR